MLVHNAGGSQRVLLNKADLIGLIVALRGGRLSLILLVGSLQTNLRDPIIGEANPSLLFYLVFSIHLSRALYPLGFIIAIEGRRRQASS